MRQVSLNKRKFDDDTYSGEVEVVLVHITHPAFSEAVRLTTDPTERLTTDPLEYGTRSMWLTSNPILTPYKFILLSAIVPDDKDDTPAAATLIIETMDNSIVELLRSTTVRATVSMAVVLASSPDIVEHQWRDMRLVSADGNTTQISLQISKEPIVSEPFPSGRFTRERFPGLIP